MHELWRDDGACLELPESSRMCSQMKRVEKICCPGANVSSRDDGEWDKYESDGSSKDNKFYSEGNMSSQEWEQSAETTGIGTGVIGQGVLQ